MRIVDPHRSSRDNKKATMTVRSIKSIFNRGRMYLLFEASRPLVEMDTLFDFKGGDRRSGIGNDFAARGAI